MPKVETADEYITRTGCLRRFEDGMRVEVIDEDHPLKGWTGRVSRIKIAGLGPWNQSPDGTFWNIPEAWVTMDADVPGNLRRFAKSDTRRNNLVFRADQVRMRA